jgi:glycosyltransferase involved in cell wall biosynthesis
MKISYAITVCNELTEIKELIEHLQEYKRPADDIVVLVDLTKNSADSELLSYLRALSVDGGIQLTEDHFNDNFSEWKNKLNRQCSGDYIFNIDADELPDEALLQTLPELLETNPIDAIWVPRINIVDGITPAHIARWGWTINENGWINWPNDAQLRIYKNKPEIRWENRVHERLTGYKTISQLPAHQDYAIWHIKTISRQERQNSYYSTL